MSKEKKIKELVELVEDWDIDTLIETAQQNMRERLEDMTEKEVNEEYHLIFGPSKGSVSGTK